MIPEEPLKELKCAFSIDKHFLVDPIILSNCGHAICKSCLPDDKIDSIKCKICGVVTQQDFSQIPISKPLKQALQLCLGNIFELIERETTEKLNFLKGATLRN